ncbi:FAD-binding oxidoreductase [Actinomycetospora flava]|uniref:FAD-binding oxidoreductase n=1 Tax=Actinomycetospora flava TaxID=3129232 RepID=A0ABU8MDV2_9PSEU
MSTPTVPTTVGAVLVPGDDAYDAERRGYNLSVDHRPAVIVAAECAEDVAAAVRFAVDHDLPVAVQATGHGPTAPADGALLLTTSRLAGIEIDPVARTARFEAGVRSGALVAAAAEHGLAPLNGSAPDVGAVGYHLGGGVGLMSRQFGYAVDHVRALEVVTADGRRRRVTAGSADPDDADLFWALRGAGKGRLGVVVAVEIDLHPVARLYGGGMHFAAGEAREVLRTWAERTAITPEAMGSSVLLIRMPDLPFLPDELRGRSVVHVRFVFTGDAAEGERLVAPFRALGPLTDTVGEMPYRDVGTIHAEPTTPVAFHARNTMLRALDQDAVDTLLEHAGPDAGAPYLVELRHLGGAAARPGAVPSALARRDGTFVLYAGGVATGTDEVAALTSSLDALLRAMDPWATGGACLNFLAGPDVTGEQVRSAYSPADRDRLREIEQRVDPGNTFRVVVPLADDQAGRTIRPSSAGAASRS